MKHGGQQKKAVIVCGEHFVGKTHTINFFLKPLLGIKAGAWTFTIEHWHDGGVYAQSSEESPRDVDYRISKLLKYTYVVTACRPKDEEGSHFTEIYLQLRQRGYDVVVFEISRENDEDDKKMIASQAYNHLKSNGEQTYLSFADEVTQIEGRWHISFDSILEKDFLNFDFNRTEQNIQRLILELSTRQIELVWSEEQYRDFFSTNEIYGEWFRIRLNDSISENRVELYTLESPEQEPEFLSALSIEGLRERSLGGLLKRTFSLSYFAEASHEDISEALGKVDFCSKYCLWVRDVGQGSCATIGGDSVDVFFDIGGGITTNKRTYRTPKNFSINEEGLVILSHWDKDHWVSALYNPQSYKMTWVVPDQKKLGVSHAKLAINIASKGRLIKWSSSTVTCVNKPGVFLYKLPDSSDRNKSGIVAVLQPEESQGVLIPGDAPYDVMPFLNKYTLQVIIVPHHGARFKNNPHPPVAQAKHQLVYSYGLNNSYKHPHPDTENVHKSQGWLNEYNTARDGDILICIHGNCTGNKPRCPYCTLCYL
ncbi:hypothetical protein PQO01_07035 [Lentisphaera marina]|uniref:hypothetical protein n=1 Tax=Lentisphaera marina TaxID=1111041 RepID=UPI00236577DB|nr:hypothetical protein [Lentisphaera marina]MDD7984701.1 hypothetical protein [Lentisphaera marina]